MYSHTQTLTVKDKTQKLVIHLKPKKTKKKVQWASNVIDNEHLGRKKSKCCCQHHSKNHSHHHH